MARDPNVTGIFTPNEDQIMPRKPRPETLAEKLAAQAAKLREASDDETDLVRRLEAIDEAELLEERSLQVAEASKTSPPKGRSALRPFGATTAHGQDDPLLPGGRPTEKERIGLQLALEERRQALNLSQREAPVELTRIAHSLNLRTGTNKETGERKLLKMGHSGWRTLVDPKPIDEPSGLGEMWWPAVAQFLGVDESTAFGIRWGQTDLTTASLLAEELRDIGQGGDSAYGTALRIIESLPRIGEALDYDTSGEVERLRVALKAEQRLRAAEAAATRREVKELAKSLANLSQRVASS